MSSLVVCSTNDGFDAIDDLIVTTVYPVIIAALLWILRTAHVAFQKDLNFRTRLSSIYFSLFLILTYLSLPFVSVSIFQIFSCTDVDPDNVQSGDDLYMSIDYSVSCSSSKYKFGFVWAIISIFVYPVGVPSFYFYVLYSARHDIIGRDPTSMDKDENDRDIRLRPIRLLYEYYEPKLWYWEILETLHRLLLTGVLVVIDQGSGTQVIVGSIIALFFLKLCSVYQPFIDPRLQILRETCQWQIFFVFFLALVLKADFQSVHRSMIDSLLVLALIANFVLDALCIIRDQFLNRKKEIRNIDLIQSFSSASKTNNPITTTSKFFCEDDSEVYNGIGIRMSVCRAPADENRKSGQQTGQQAAISPQAM